MKKLALLFILSLVSLTSFCQVLDVQTKTTTSKKIVKFNNKFYIETIQTTTSYSEVTTDVFLSVDRDSDEEIRDEQEKVRVTEFAKDKKAERIERNKLLKDAIKKGYEPEINTLEEKERVEKIKAKINSIK